MRSLRLRQGRDLRGERYHEDPRLGLGDIRCDQRGRRHRVRCQRPLRHRLRLRQGRCLRGELRDGNTVSVISDSNNSIVATVNVGSEPYGVAYDSAKGELFVTNYDDNTVSVISDSTNTMYRYHRRLPRDRRGISYDSAKGELFVADSGTSASPPGRDGLQRRDQCATTAIGTPESATLVLAYDSGKGEVFVGGGMTTPSRSSQTARSPRARPSTASTFAHRRRRSILHFPVLQPRLHWLSALGKLHDLHLRDGHRPGWPGHRRSRPGPSRSRLRL